MEGGHGNGDVLVDFLHLAFLIRFYNVFYAVKGTATNGVNEKKGNKRPHSEER